MELGDHQEQIGGIDHTSRDTAIGDSELWCCYLIMIYEVVRTMDWIFLSTVTRKYFFVRTYDLVSICTKAQMMEI